MTASIVAEALGDVQDFFDNMFDTASKAAVLAINQVSERDGLALIKQDMQMQVDFPAGYLNTHLTVARRAAKGRLEAVIRGRDRATSLARFAQGQNLGNSKGRPLFVTVRKGQQKTLKNAFLIKLRNGNTGLAVRLRNGDSLRHSGAAVKLANNLYLLYGPSVDQVFRGVAEDRSGEILDMVGRQFLRQFSRLSTSG